MSQARDGAQVPRVSAAPLNDSPDGAVDGAVSRSPDGLLLVDKPAGMTSHDAVAIVRRAAGVRRVGHAGTLDPFATGLLVLLLGRATRVMPYLAGEPKVYEATIRFGSETETDDADGQPTRLAAPPGGDAVRAAILALTGLIAQVPPAYSAKQVAGRRAYDAARAGRPLALPAVTVTVHQWAIDDWDGESLRARITCGGGTYIRALARDLGRATGSAGHLASLRRTASGPFRVADAITVSSIREGAALPVQSPLAGLADCASDRLDADGVRRVLHGLPVPAMVAGRHAALRDDAGVLVAVADRDGDQWRPRVVLRDA